MRGYIHKEKKGRIRPKNIKRWTLSDETNIINFLKQNRDFENPTARVYYTKFMEEHGMNIYWKLVLYKVRNMRTVYRRAKEYEINKKDCNDMDNEEVRSIIKCITLTTLYMNSMWWPPNKSLGGFLNQALFLIFSSLATFNYVMATLTGPGILPKNWKPQDPNAVEFLQYCKVCEGYKAPRSHHCRKCNRCIKKMDHHCPWINHCVGWANHAYFTYFLAFSIIGSLHGAIILCITFYRGIHRYWYLSRGLVHLATVQFSMHSIILCIFSMGLAIGVVIALGMLLYFQLKSIVKNQTGIEMWIVEKATYRRMHNTDLDNFVYPYDLGRWSNIKQVFISSNVARGCGIEWPVKDGCNPYTLTSEQISQKCEKRARTRTYKCIRRATGSYLPIFSQGFRVCLSLPCTDEPRLRLDPEDIIKVTRFRTHWLFGELVADAGKDKDNKERRPLRGWFPRRCAIELIQPEQPYSSGEDYDITQGDKCRQQRSKDYVDNNGTTRKSQNCHNRKKIN